MRNKNLYRVYQNSRLFTEPQIQISRNLLYKLDSSECLELMIRKAAQDLTHLGILGRYD